MQLIVKVVMSYIIFKINGYKLLEISWLKVDLIVKCV